MRSVFACLLCATFTLSAQNIRITSTNPVIPTGGGRVTWGGKNNLLAFDKPSASGFYDIYTSNPDGSNVACLTCGTTNLPAFNKGDPEWHPSNNYLAIGVQWQAISPGDPTFPFYTPGEGVGTDLYIMDAAGKNYWRVTQNSPGILHPRFSHDGTKLLWVQRARGDGSFWSLLLADFLVVNGNPVVTNIQSLPPCASQVFCETGGFSRDDSQVFFTGRLDGQPETGLDIYSYNLKTGATARLTSTPDRWDEFPYSLPNADKLIWMSGVASGAGSSFVLQTDYWTMNYDGSEKTQVSFYNYRTAPAWYTGNGVSVARLSFNGDGTQIAAHTIPNGVTSTTAGTVTIIGVEPAAATVSGASFLPPPLSAQSISSTFNPKLATATASATDQNTSNLAGTTITVQDSQGTTRDALLFYASAGQLNWLIPAGTALGPATVTFTASDGTVARSTIDVENVGPGLFTQSGDGSGPPAAYATLYRSGSAGALSTEYPFNCSPCSVAPINLGSPDDTVYLTLFGTGMRNAANVVANIGGTTYPVSFSGAQGAFMGLDQVNILLPHTLAGMGVTTAYLIVDGVPTNSVQLSF